MYEYAVKLKSVYDGDTVVVDIDLGFDVWLNEQRVRIDGIDAPEIKTRDADEKRFGIEAQRFLSHLLYGRPLKVQVAKYNASEKFGRILGDILIGRPLMPEGSGYTWVSARDEILSYGRAREYHGGPR